LKLRNQEYYGFSKDYGFSFVRWLFVRFFPSFVLFFSPLLYICRRFLVKDRLFSCNMRIIMSASLFFFLAYLYIISDLCRERETSQRVYLFLRGPPECVHSPFPVTWGRKRSWLPIWYASILQSSRRVFLNYEYLNYRQKPTNWKQLVRFLKLNYLIEGNNQRLL
jgi:hypothetical protein